MRHHTVFAEGHTSTSSQSKKPPDFSGAHFRNVSIVPKKKKVTCNGKGETLRLIQSTTGRKAIGETRGEEEVKQPLFFGYSGSSCSAHVLRTIFFWSGWSCSAHVLSTIFFCSGPGVVRSLAV